MTKDKKEFKIGFGVLEPSLVKQINEQGLRWIPTSVKCFEKSREAINWLYFHKIITDSQKSKLQEKLFKRILSHVRKCTNKKTK